jgi:putative phage-type endonuclease
MEQRSEEWHKARLGLITASSVGAILGNSPNGTRADVMRRMVRDWHGADPEFTGNIATEYGVNNEAGAIVEYTMETANTVQPIGFVTREDWAGCSPDGSIGTGDDEGGLEVKCPFGLRNDVNPQFKTLLDQPHYHDQVQFSLWVTGWKFWHFYQWNPVATKMECVLPDLDWQAKNLPILRQFHAEYLEERETNAAMHLAPKRAEIDTPEAHKIMSEYDQLSEAIENATARKAELLADMVRIAGEKDAIFAGRKLTKTTKAGSVSYAKALAKYAPNADLETFRGKPSSYWGVK